MITGELSPRLYEMSFLHLLSIQRKPHGGSHIGSAAYMDALTVRLDNVFADSQSQARSPAVAAAGRIGTIKAFEYASHMLFVDANTIIADFDQYVPVVGAVNAGYYTAVLFTILGGVLH